MGEQTAISWTDHTFNPWWGCMKVSPACTHCYAETWSKRTGHAIWGNHAPRRFFGEKHWGDPVRWNKAAERDGVRRRVFCASMADIFEDLPTDHPQHDEMGRERLRLFCLIEATPHLDWLLLTKRPENIEAMIPVAWVAGIPQNIWFGFTAEDQEWFDKRIGHMAKFACTYEPAIVFVSIEPMLGPVSLYGYLGECLDCDAYMAQHREAEETLYHGEPFIDWAIVGGESGPGARPMHPAWVRSVRDRCNAADVAFHFKQWGEWAHGSQCADLDLDPDWLMHRQQHRWSADANDVSYHMGKKAAGHLLDGREWLDFPSPRKKPGAKK